MASSMRVLQDLRIAGSLDFPDSGIPQETRLLFKTLSHASGIEVAGLIHPDFSTPRLAESVRRNPVAAGAMLLNGYGISFGARQRRGGILRAIRSAYEKFVARNRVHPVVPLDPMLSEGVWRRYLERSLAIEDRALLDGAKFMISTVTEQSLQRTSLRRMPRIEAQGFDFVIFPDVRLARLPAGARSLIRYYDSLPVLAGDLFPPGSAGVHYNLLKAAMQESFFVCISEATRSNLVGLFPQAAERSAVIPCTLGPIGDRSALSVPEIVTRNLYRGEKGDVRPVGGDRRMEHGDRYILMVSTIERRKNHRTAIEAFEVLKARRGFESLKFVVVGRPSTGFAAAEQAMAVGQREGSIFHLAGVARAELNTLYANSEALLFPSLDEGFGFTPLEALSHGTPAVVSDIATHRWVLGDAALYAPAMQPRDIADQLQRLLGGDGEALASDLVARGNNVLARYSVERTAGQWSDLLGQLKGGSSR